ncbi:hypothetical protein Taro_048904 [Colocasia esculenta]|uniref:Disease resistance protein RGA3 n=1 Tax=Colocasia esculenta TaxID=4460 RepID=A0A843X9E7_COLES|nr:hypothetical protein [Colocasia esculenta]
MTGLLGLPNSMLQQLRTTRKLTGKVSPPCHIRRGYSADTVADHRGANSQGPQLMLTRDEPRRPYLLWSVRARRHRREKEERREGAMALLAKVGGAAVSVLLEKGFERAICELQQICRVPQEMQRLVTTLNLIKEVLQDAEAKQMADEAVGHWLREVKQVFFDAEDLVDEHTTDAAQQSTGADGRKKIREIHARIDHLAREKHMLGLQVSQSPAAVESRRLELTRRRQTSSLLADENSVIGRHAEKEEIIQFLLSSSTHTEAETSNNRSFSVLPIVGIGGTGKTTLARLVFNDRRVRTHFQLVIWVCISIVFDVERVTEEIISGSSAPGRKEEPSQSSHWDWMQNELRRKVEGRTLLLVLDDVWEANPFKWEKLFEPLKFAGEGSKLLITTRNRAAVDMIRGRMDSILLKGLSDDHMWCLFKRYAFGGVTDAYGTIATEYFHLEGIGRCMLPRLKGSPLAVRTVGSLLSTELDAEHWITVLESKLWELPQGPDDIFPALSLSYQYLRGDLKNCFAYCSLFPTNHQFNKEEVVQLWMAQCFVTRERGRRIEATGCRYFEELLYRSFFEPSNSKENNYVMPDLIHQLAEYASLDDCFRVEEYPGSSMEISDTVRHISLQVTEFDRGLQEELCRHRKLRTLLFLERCVFDDLRSYGLDELFLKLKRLRVLRLCGCELTELPSSIGGLKHLRYLDLTGSYRLQKLPETFCDLYNLQVLKLFGCNCFGAFPPRTSELINLRHLQADYELVSDIDGLRELTGLQELKVSGRAVGELGRLCKLRRLEILYLKDVHSREEAVQARLGSKEHLQELSLEWSDCVDPETLARNADPVNRALQEDVLQALHPVATIRELEIQRYGGVRPPLWMVDPPTWSSFCLESIDLCGCPNWEVLPSLGLLRRLKSLQLRHMHGVRQLHLEPPFFPSLEVLHVCDLPQWEQWKGPEGAGSGNNITGSRPPPHKQASISSCFFPRLRELNIRDCPKLGELPTLPPTLRQLNLLAVGVTHLPELWGCRRDKGDQEEASSSGSSSATAALVEISISRCPKLTSVMGLLRQHLTALQKLSIWSCQELASGLPEKGLGHLASLRILYMWKCPKLTPRSRQPEEEEDGEAPSLPLPRSLEHLQIVDCGDAMGGWWWGGLQHLTSLSHLMLVGCPSTAASFFTSVGRHRHHRRLAATLTELKIRDCGLAGHQQGSSHVSTSSSVPLLPGPTSPGDATGGFWVLTSLTKLELCRSSHLLQHGPLPWSLRSLTIAGDDNLITDECMSACLRDLTSLKELTISRFENLCSLTRTLSGLSALESLEIKFCPAVQSLPEMGLPPSLQRLVIRGCPALAEHCRSQQGPEWSKISHIPFVYM